jgi:hypothetical protein
LNHGRIPCDRRQVVVDKPHVVEEGVGHASQQAGAGLRRDRDLLHGHALQMGAVAIDEHRGVRRIHDVEAVDMRVVDRVVVAEEQAHSLASDGVVLDL